LGSLANSVIFGVLVMSMLLGAQDIVRWKVVALAIASIFINFTLRELMPGLIGALAAALITVAVVGLGLVRWCEIERRIAARILAAYFGCSLVVNVFCVLLDSPLA
jgi:hypothetical protein